MNGGRDLIKLFFGFDYSLHPPSVFIKHKIMSESKKENGFVALLQLAFIVLKLIGIINWRWWIVLLPFEISLVVLIIWAIIYLILLRK